MSVREDIIGLYIELRPAGRLRIEVHKRPENSADITSSSTTYSINSDSDILIQMPNVDKLKYLEYLNIRSTVRGSQRLILDTDMLCGLTNLRYLIVRRTIIRINDANCIALPNLFSVDIADSEFDIDLNLLYDNVLEMFADHSPNLDSIIIRNTDIVGSVPESLSNLSKLKYLYLRDNPDLEY